MAELPSGNFVRLASGSPGAPRRATLYDALGALLQNPPPPGSFPQASAVDSKMLSETQAGVTYGFRPGSFFTGESFCFFSFMSLSRFHPAAESELPGAFSPAALPACSNPTAKLRQPKHAFAAKQKT
jgi:hypothetical protein